MIPKIIHYCWLSGDEFPSNIKACINTWKTHLPDYEFVLWDTNKFNVNQTIWTQQAYNKKKYAFASDYIRLYALYNYGGIYLDTDVEVLKSFNDLLELPYFIGMEQNEIFEAAVIGAEKDSDWVKNCLDYYTDRFFVKEDGSLDLEIIPNIMAKEIAKRKTIVEIDSNDALSLKSRIINKSEFYLFPFEFFSAKNHLTHKITPTENTYTIHHFNNSWVPKRKKYRRTLKRAFINLFGMKTTERLILLIGFRRVKRIFDDAYTSK